MTTTPMTLTVRSPEDMLALVPFVLGFLPEESVVMLTFDAECPFHARLDLPRARADIPDLVPMLLAPARSNGARRVFFVVYSADARLVGAIALALVSDFEAAGIDVIDVLRADGDRWYAALGARPDVPDDGVHYDVSAHRFSAQSVLDGRVIHPSREALRASLDSQPDRVGLVVAALAEQSGASPPAEDADWVSGLVERHVRDGTVADDRELARLLKAILAPRVRDAAWSALTRRQAPDHIRFWIDAVRRAPAPLVGGPAAVLALTAWVAGQGALAWCAVDRCTDVDERNSLALLVGDILARSLSPDVWDDIR